MTVKFSKDLRTEEDIVAWQARLNREWPQRHTIAKQIAREVDTLGQSQPLVIELACGSGYLAEWLLRTLPHTRYIGFDQSPYMLRYARRHLKTIAYREKWRGEICLHETDLNEEGWIDWLGQHHCIGHVDAVVSLQSFHDLGSEAEQLAVMCRVHTFLKTNGIFINADLLRQSQNPHPHRLPAYRHVELMYEAGFEQVNCRLQAGEFGIFVATVTR